MAKGRWQHLDLRKPAKNAPAAPLSSPEPAPLAPTPTAVPAPEVGLRPIVQQARALYVLQQFEQCADLLTAALAADPDLPGAQAWLGLALGRLDFIGEAVEHLRNALREKPDDPELRASLISAELRARMLPDTFLRDAAGAGAELTASAEWVRGQHALGEGRALEAAQLFQSAGERFARHSPAEAIPERVAAAYIGEVVSQLAAGNLDAAQRSFSTLRERARLPEATLRFARGLYELADALRELAPAERSAELEPLVEAVLAARLRVRFYDGTRPVDLYWENLP